MNYQLFLDLTTELGYRLSRCGAETYRVEESINRILSAYGIPSETYAIPNCLTVTIMTDDDMPLTRMRRIDNVVSDLDAVERYSGSAMKSLLPGQPWNGSGIRTVTGSSTLPSGFTQVMCWVPRASAGSMEALSPTVCAPVSAAL